MNYGDKCTYKKGSVYFLGRLVGGFKKSNGEIWLSIETYEGCIFHGLREDFTPGHSDDYSIKKGDLVIRDRSHEPAKRSVIPRDPNKGKY